MRRSPPSDGSSPDGSEYAESDVDCSEASHADTDLTDDETCVDEDGERGEGVERRAWPVDEEIPPEYYLEQMRTFDEAEYDQQDYGKSTTRLLDRMEDLWHECVTGPYTPETQYSKLKLTRCRCWTYLKEERHRAYTTVSLRTLNTFFDWLLGRTTGKRGRKVRGTKIQSSLGTYWKVFRLVYERATGGKLDGTINRRMHRVCTPLVPFQVLPYVPCLT
jgi:hypothetical protein